MKVKYLAIDHLICRGTWARIALCGHAGRASVRASRWRPRGCKQWGLTANACTRSTQTETRGVEGGRVEIRATGIRPPTPTTANDTDGDSRGRDTCRPSRAPIQVTTTPSTPLDTPLPHPLDRPRAETSPRASTSRRVIFNEPNYYSCTSIASVGSTAQQHSFLLTIHSHSPSPYISSFCNHHFNL